MSRSLLLASLLAFLVTPAFAAPAVPAPKPLAIANTPANWAQTLERIATGVVTIQIDSTRAFDTEWNTTAQATGFVIDAKRGLILTNRHVVTPGPVTAQAIFLNREEVQLYPIYRDPIHDFGIYHYDPAKLHFIQPAELPLYPQGAVIGREIRVVGNDAGEQLSILAGTLARLDREAPEYGYGKYNDFNTFYYQAASSTSGGSSGSPVIDIEGRVVALNAGGATGAASSFYLPLTAVVRALKYLEVGKPVPRGTLETVFKYTPYDELKRLGLNAETEASMRKGYPKLTGMLVVDDVQPGSGADGILAPGDILVAIDGKPIPEFFALEEVLDSHVGRRVKVEVQRGSQSLQHDLDVKSLGDITPAEFIEFGEAVVHTLSYQQARHFNVPIKGVYVANPGYVFGAAGIPRAALISSFNGKKVDNLEDFDAALAELADGARVPVRYVTIEDPRAAQLKVIRMDRRWFPARKCKRDDTLGTWPCISLSPGRRHRGQARLHAVRENRRSAHRSLGAVAGDGELRHAVFDLGRDREELSRHRRDRRCAARPGGDRSQYGAGGDGRCADHVRRHGRSAGQGRVHSSAAQSRRRFLRPKSIGSTPVRAATLVTRRLSPGDDVWVVGERADSKIHVAEDPDFQRRCGFISAVAHAALPRQQSGSGKPDQSARPITTACLTDEKGDVLALWSSFAFESQRELEQVNRGIPADLVSEMIGVVADGRPLYSFEAEFDVQSLAGARELGLPDEWVRRFEEHNPQRRQVLGINRLVAGSPAAALLEPGDLLLAIDGKIVESLPRGRARSAEARGQRDRVARRRREDAANEDRGIERPRHRPGAHLGRRHAAGAASRHGGAARHRALWRVRIVLLLRIAGHALRLVCGPAHHRSRWPADAGSRRLHQGGERQTRSCIAAPQDHQLERPDRCDYVEARQALLAGL